MAARRVLLIDADPRFCEVLRRSLGPLGFEIQVSLDEGQWLHELEASPPDLVVVGVDHPDTTGFARFAKVKSVARRVPVALVTATLSESEMGLHEKLRVHAHAYLDKRTATPEALLEKLEPYLGARPDPPVPAVPEDAAPSPDLGVSGEEAWLAGFLREGIDPELAAGLERALGSADPQPAPTRERAAPASTEAIARIAELEADLERAHRELLDARREARSSPFSGDFLSMRQVASRREADIGRLRAELRERDQRIAQLKGLIQQLGRRLVPLMNERDQAVEHAEELRSRTENAEAETHRAIAQSEEFRKRLESSLGEAKASADRERAEQARAREVQELALAELRAGYVEHLDRSAREHEASLRAAQKRHHDEVAALSRAHEKALAQRDELNQAALRDGVARERAALEARVAASERGREKDLAALREQHAHALSNLERAQEEELDRVEKAASQARDFAVAAEETAWTERLETQRREHESALTLLRRQHQDALVSLRASMDEAIAGRERSLRSTVSEAVSAERSQWQRRLEKAAAEHGRALAALQREHQGELARLRVAHEGAWATRERENEAARSREVAQERSRCEVELVDSQREHEKALEALRRQHAGELEALRGSHREEAEAARREYAQSLAAEALRTPPEAQRRLEAADERARDLEVRLEETVRDLLARDASLASLQQELGERTETTGSLATGIRELGRTIEGLVEEGAPADLIALAVQSSVAGLTRPGKKHRPGA